MPLTTDDDPLVLPCDDLAEAIEFLQTRLGMRLERIWPADDPARALLSAPGGWTRLERGTEAIDLREPPRRDAAEALSRVGDAPWVVGRAGMRYRDLLPGRAGGRIVASHIHVPTAGPVPDYVHHHAIRFQMIFCHRGWVRLVYEDQGAPFVMRAGDCVLQPPGIRHRVLESGDDLHVIEVGAPAIHETILDHEMVLPNGPRRPERMFGDQRFVWQQAGEADSHSDSHSGYLSRDLGIGAATAGVADAWVHRPSPRAEASPAMAIEHQGELLLVVVLAGSIRVSSAGATFELTEGDAVSLAAGRPYALEEPSDDCELLEVSVP